ncbi:MAG: AIR synthase family protein [Promethearchaeota archaeon]
MTPIKNKLALGKLKHKLLRNLLNDFISDLNDDRVIIGSKIGEDAAVIDMGNKYLVAKTDPITFATDEIGYYAVNINVNDIVCMGATPKWFQSTILFPENKTTDELVKQVFKNIHDTCSEMNIAVIGGHTEVTAGLDRPIVIGSLLGEVDKDSLVSSSGIKLGDSLILTKGIFIEGTSIIGREKEQELINKGYDEVFIKKCKNYLYDPGISVAKEALLATANFKVNAMHDPTEGGLACGIAEMAIASNMGVQIEFDKIKVLPEPQELSKVFRLEPMNTISSGSLLIAIDDEYSSDLLDLLKKNKIKAEKIGTFISKEKGLRVRTPKGKVESLNYTETDEITKLF